MVTIDYESFPHIIDLIWSHLDVEGLLAVRHSSSSWRTRANKILQRHMTLEVLFGKKEFALKLSLKHEEGHASTTGSLSHVRLPHYYVDYSMADIKDEDLGRLPSGVAGDILSGALHNLAVLDVIYHENDIEKWLPEMLKLFGPDTVVYFLNMGNMLQLEFMEAPDTLVLNLDCVGPKASPLELQFQRLLDPGDVAGTDITFILDHGALEGNRPNAVWVENLEMTLAPIWTVATVTLVGLERFFRKAWVFDIFKQDSYATAANTFAYMGEVYNPTAEADMLKRFAVAVKHKELRKCGAVRLLTHEEYEAVLGHDKYMIYTSYEQQSQISPVEHPQSGSA